VNTGVNVWGSIKGLNMLSCFTTVSFSKMTVLRGVNTVSEEVREIVRSVIKLGIPTSPECCTCRLAVLQMVSGCNVIMESYEICTFVGY
jgi:hypothetical protein